jgi:signal transduction histidine kinase
VAQPWVLIVDESAPRLSWYRSVIGDLAAISAPAAGDNLIESLQHDYAVILLNRTATAARLRAHPATQRTPLLFVATTDTAALPAGLTGPVDFLPMPPDPAALRMKVQLFVELQHANVQLAQLHEQYLAIMLHELRTPLNAILGWTTLLRTGRVEAPTAERALETIERNARAQTHLIEELQDEARIIAGKVQLELAEMDPRQLVDAALAAMTPAAQARQVTLRADFVGESGPVRADFARLRQLLGHLLANAIRASAAGDEVRVRVDPGVAELRISVIDSGVGIAPEMLPQLFDRFRQDEGTSGRRRSGRGLGLTLVRRLIELHGGTVSADSAGEGQGTTVTVRLPAGISS